MIRKLVSAALSILLLTGLTGCVTDLGTGIIKNLRIIKRVSARNSVSCGTLS